MICLLIRINTEVGSKKIRTVHKFVFKISEDKDLNNSKIPKPFDNCNNNKSNFPTKFR